MRIRHAIPLVAFYNPGICDLWRQMITMGHLHSRRRGPLEVEAIAFSSPVY
jgi:hypothetical protein